MSSDGLEKPSRPSRFGSRKRMILIATAVALVVLGLALGLGLGLGLGNNGDDDGDDNNPEPTTPTSTPTPTAAPGNVWQPAVNASWQIILSKTLEIDSNSPSVTPDVDVFDIDMFLHQNDTIIESLHKLNKKVICYFSAGSYEPGRPDSSQFQESDKGKELDGWPGEYWLNLSSTNVRNIMTNRIKIAQDIGCDAVDPDNVDGYQNDNGFDLQSSDSIDFVNFLATEASSRNLGVGLKNAGDIIGDVQSVVQFSVNEQCAEYDECDTFADFINNGKPVFHIEYPDGAGSRISSSNVNKDCDAASSSLFSTVMKNMDLDGWVQYCSGMTADTDTTS